MENKLQIFQNSEFGQLRTVEINGEIYFVGKDVAEILGYQRTADAITAHVDEEDKGVCKMPTPGGKQEMTVINESGLYSLVLSSKLPTAKKFKHWVTAEVIPLIRKTGSYSAKPITALTALEQTLTVLKEQDARITAVESEQKNQRSMLEWLNPTPGETPRQKLDRLVKEYATTYPNYEKNKANAHRQAWVDFIRVFDGDQRKKIWTRARNSNCRAIDVIEKNNWLTQAITIISKMLINARKRIL